MFIHVLNFSQCRLCDVVCWFWWCGIGWKGIDNWLVSLSFSRNWNIYRPPPPFLLSYCDFFFWQNMIRKPATVGGEDDLIPLKWIYFQNQFIMETQKSPKYSSIVADISANEVSKAYSKTLILFRMVDWNPYSIYFFDTFLML